MVTLHKGSNYHSTLINLQTKNAMFALFVGVVGSCWLGGKGNFNKFLFKTHTLIQHFQSSWKIPSS
jgi:hypothetical protein